ncbi:SDR family oxidoreductase [Aquimarina sp. D1M17]|uniref:SDR family oxidoreductase n=1 Tax=Aquimarina acroporae TaxID=2937283 RepID=UPI0020BE104E|nr:SDR family oxidoreductase [Aquimarina acroporae]MCK8521789.1 SDR family oxidoreductase [Aquimarina acroporae]
MRIEKEKKILLAGGTGYLGGYIAKEIVNNNLSARFITRDKKKMQEFESSSIEVIEAEVTKPETLTGVCKGVDVVISTVGITRQKDGLSYMDVDYQANVNLLREAQRAGVRKFIYVSAINGDLHRHLKIFEAKEAFVDELKKSGLDYTILRPNGFFSDMRDFLSMANKGSVFLFGKGNQLLNPIHGEDLAQMCLNLIDNPTTECSVGGPDVLTHNEIAEMAFHVLHKKPKVMHLPNWTRLLTLWLLRKLTKESTYGPIEFFLTMMADDNVAMRYGTRRLKQYYKENASMV